MFRDIAEGPQPVGAAIQKSHLELEPSWQFEALADVLGCVPKGPQADWQRQTLAGVAVGTGGFRGEPSREPFGRRAQAVGPSFARVLLNMAEVMIVTEALKNHIPQGHQRSEGAGIEGSFRESQPAGQQWNWQELGKMAEQLLGGEAAA